MLHLLFNLNDKERYLYRFESPSKGCRSLTEGVSGFSNKVRSTLVERLASMTPFFSPLNLSRGNLELVGQVLQLARQTSLLFSHLGDFLGAGQGQQC